MADFNLGRAFAEGVSTRGDLLLRDRGLKEGARQFNIQSGLEQERLDLNRDIAAPQIKAAEEELAQQKRAQLSQSQAGRAFLDLSDALQDDPESFHDRDGTGELVKEVIGPKSAAQQVYKAAIKYNLDAQGVDVLLGLISSTLKADAEWLKNVRATVKKNIEVQAGKQLISAIKDVDEDIKAGEDAKKIQDDLDRALIAEGALTGQKVTQGETFTGARLASETAATARPVSKVEELKTLIATFDEAGEKDPVRAAIDRIYPLDKLGNLIRAYSDYSLFAQPGDPIAANMQKVIVQQIKTFTGESKKDQTTPNGAKYTRNTFPTMVTLSEGGWLDTPTGIEDFIRSKWGEIGFTLQESGVTLEQYKRWIYDEFMEEIERGGWIKDGGQ